MVSDKLAKMNVQIIGGCCGAEYLGNCRYSLTGDGLDLIYDNYVELNLIYKYVNGSWVRDWNYD